ncbi:MAG: DNA cytosine methyltransferase [Deltaproteobacteria bacterium]|nr:DNA cytosine methyltransferase [Deltaproteobacteria bacterium]
MEEALNGLAVCAGVGGLELGLRIALGHAYRTVCYVEREAYAAACLVARMEESALDIAPVWDDLTTFDGSLWRGVVDIVVAGEPCQPFSLAGKRRGASDSRYLWPQVARIVREVEPSLVFLENVSGAVDARYGHKAELESLGYRVEAGLFSAEEVGATQKRLRLFILAHSGGKGLSNSRREWVPCSETGCFNKGPAIERNGPRMFPPGPKDINGWRRVIADNPQVEPAVRGDADGPTIRVDRLRATGNGVVPVVAALAFATLWGRLR